MIEHFGHRFYAVQGTHKCAHALPKRNMSVWYQRTVTGGSTIYLMPDKRGTVKNFFANAAFGWVSENECLMVNLEHDAEWCNYYPPSDVVAKELNEISGHHRTTAWIRFMRSKHEHWKTPWTGAAPQPIHKENDMGTFDPYSAAADQSARLNPRINQGKSVSIRDKCGSAVDTIVTNNKVAAKQAAFNEVGRIANNVAAKTLAKHLPAMARGYADTPIGKLLIANLAITAQQHFKPGDPTLAKVTAAMGVAAYGDVFKAIDVEGFINSILADKALQNALTAASDD